VEQDRYPINRYSWEIPGGGALPEEDVLAAAQRDLKEEIGLTANKWNLLLRMYASNSITDEEVFVYLAEGLTQGERNLEETERIMLQKIALKNAARMIDSGEITDSMTVAGILRLIVRDKDRKGVNDL
jgi:8-oxo-dGTP pyrophosphatase MutT (NUDIX family)